MSFKNRDIVTKYEMRTGICKKMCTRIQKVYKKTNKMLPYEM